MGRMQGDEGPTDFPGFKPPGYTIVTVEDFEKFFQESPPKIESLSEQVKEPLSLDLSKVGALLNIDLEKCKTDAGF
ncbi:3031_t:CDS:2 [Ambispora gerdemannii]|uniref:3031_t:CDS:1 n=1 Tax=Ambispora gerdemannii TaxID=144530 RepID=A0A9N9BU28_9GLOM|nr:3031_t:CDS:2 [Ambispora gerdemannii]